MLWRSIDVQQALIGVQSVTRRTMASSNRAKFN
jgi:hypothetical protein